VNLNIYWSLHFFFAYVLQNPIRFLHISILLADQPASLAYYLWKIIIVLHVFHALHTHSYTDLTPQVS